MKNDYFFETKNANVKILDCGANIGMSVLYFKMLYPNSKIIAFEPNPHAFALLKENINQNNLKDVTIYNVGLSDKPGTADFYYLPRDLASLKGSISAHCNEGQLIKITVECLSDYLKETQYDLVKIDVEGAELSILQDLVTTEVLNKSDKYIIEYHHKMKHDASKLSHFLKPFEDYGFEYNLKTTFNKQGQFQDILIYIYKKILAKNVIKKIKT